MLFISCKKYYEDPTKEKEAEMQYSELNDTAIIFNKGASFDVDGDRQKDIYFTTLYVGDPILQADKKQWLAGSSFYTNLPVNEKENIPVLNSLDRIPVGNFNGYSWYNASTIILAQKIITNTAPSYWLGQWKDVSHKFVPFQVIRTNGFYNGWVEVSFDTQAEKIILHKAAVSKEANKPVKAGL